MVNEFGSIYAPKNPKSILESNPARTEIADKILSGYTNDLQRVKNDLANKNLNWEEVEALHPAAMAGYGKEALEIIMPAYEKTPFKNWIDLPPLLVRAANGYEGAQATFALLDKYKNNLEAIGMRKELLAGIFQIASHSDSKMRKESFDRAFFAFNQCNAFGKKFFSGTIDDSVDFETSKHIVDTMKSYAPSFDDLFLLKSVLLKCADCGEPQKVYELLSQHVNLEAYFLKHDNVTAFARNPKTAKKICTEHPPWVESRRLDTAFQASLLYGEQGSYAMQNIYHPSFFDDMILMPELTEAEKTKNLQRKGRIAAIFLALCETGFTNEAWDLAKKRIFSRFEKNTSYGAARVLSNFMPEKVWDMIASTPEQFNRGDLQFLTLSSASAQHKEVQLQNIPAIRDKKSEPIESLKAKWDDLFFTYNINPLIDSLLREENKGDRGPAQDAFFKVLKTLPPIEQFFILRSVTDIGTSSKNLWEGFRTGNFHTKMYKSGSVFEFLSGPLIKKESGVLFKHTIDSHSASAWQIAHDLGIPVAPIIRSYKQHENASRVYSRFCGFSCNVYEVLSCQAQDANTLTLIWEIFEKKNRILAALQQQNDLHICHGHPHVGNITVEYIEKEYFKKFENVNTIPWQKDKIIFDPTEYLKNKDAYEVVVRLIDWDRAKTLPKK